MPRVGFTPDNKQTNAFDYPKLFLDKNERARVIALEKEPYFEFIHTLRMPVLIGGKPKIIQTTRFGKDVEEPEYEFVGRHICIGDYEAIKEKGVDAKGCPVCLASTETDAVKPPERRFAMHVVRYATQPGSFNVQEPFSVTLIAWTFGNKIFDQLVDFGEEWGDLKKHDLLLGPCEVKQFQKFDIQVAQKAEWLTSDARKQHVAAVYKENQCKDLSAMIARKLTREMIEEDLEKVLRTHRQAFGKAAEEAAVDPSDEPDLGDLFGGGDTSQVDDLTAPAATEVDLEAELDAASEPAPETSPAEGAPVEEFDLESLLDEV